jgi:hypothetical protein
MRKIPLSEIEELKKTYFADFFCSIKALDLQKYFEPYWKDDTCLKPKYKNDYWLWEQYKSIVRKFDGPESDEFTNLLFDRYIHDNDFINFMILYKKFFDGHIGLQGDDMFDFYDNYHYKGVNIYLTSSFRLKEGEVLKHFCFWLKKNGIYNQIEVCGNTNWQKKICKQYLDAYFNRTPIVQKKNFISNLTSIVRNFFSK